MLKRQESCLTFFGDPFSSFSNHFSYRVKMFSGAISFCRRAVLTLVVRIARPESLAIWHRGRSHRRPNRSGSPHRRHFASLDLKKHPDSSHRRPTSQDFRRCFSCIFLRFQIKRMCFRIATKHFFRIASDLGMCDSNRIAHRGCIARFGPLRS